MAFKVAVVGYSTPSVQPGTGFIEFSAECFAVDTADLEATTIFSVSGILLDPSDPSGWQNATVTAIGTRAAELGFTGLTSADIRQLRVPN
jgi:hypothetical protein